jgi:hypothetical protein
MENSILLHDCFTATMTLVVATTKTPGTITNKQQRVNIVLKYITI